MRWIVIALVLLAMSGYWLYREPSVSKADIYIKRLVYLNRDNKLFTGILRIDDNASQFHQSFCNGIPCGKYAEQQKEGSSISRGEYISLDKLAAIKKEFATDTITVNLLQAGGDVASDPYYLSVTILRDDAFFEDKNSLLPSSKIVEAAMRDTQEFHYDYLTITFANAMYDATRYCYKEYKVKNGQVIEETPAYEEWQLRNGVMQQVTLK